MPVRIFQKRTRFCFPVAVNDSNFQIISKILFITVTVLNVRNWVFHGAVEGTPTKRQISKRPVSKRLKRQVYKTSGLQNVRFTKRQVYKTPGLQKNIHIYSVLVVGGNPQVLLQLCLQAK